MTGLEILQIALIASCVATALWGGYIVYKARKAAQGIEDELSKLQKRD